MGYPKAIFKINIVKKQLIKYLNGSAES